jgi:hypothetical protein
MTQFLEDKNYSTNAVALLVTLLGFISGSGFLVSVGFFALSGALQPNWLAIHMLFEKGPLFARLRGVIP